MEETISKAIILVSFIVCGYFMKRIHLFTQQSFNTISTIVFRLTLPAAIVVNLNGVHFERNYLFISMLAILFNFVFIGIGYLLGRGREEKSFYMINLNGFNIGNFALPFVSYFFDSAAVLIVCLFDAGNSIMCLGMAYGLAAYVRGQRNENIAKLLAQTILTSSPVICYLIMVILAMFSLKLPDVVIEWMKIPAAGNTFLSMLMIGVAIGVSLQSKFLHQIGKNILGRFCGSVAMGLLVWYAVPYSLDIKKVIIILIFSPIASMACYFTAKMKANIQVAACISSLYIVISTVIMSTLIIIFSHLV